jgi:hypothetical membrane protein
MLACGAVGATLFVVVFLVDGVVHTGYDPARRTVSELAIGPGGWVQIANFIVTGALMLAFAAGLRRALRPGPAATWAPVLIAAYGTGLILSGVFVTDPTHSGVQTVHGTIHTLVAVVVFGSLTAACFVLARRFTERRWAWYSRVTGVVLPVFFVAMGGGPAAVSGVLQRIAIVVGWTWVAAVSLRMALRSPRPVVAVATEER